MEMEQSPEVLDTGKLVEAQIEAITPKTLPEFDMDHATAEEVAVAVTTSLDLLTGKAIEKPHVAFGFSGNLIPRDGANDRQLEAIEEVRIITDALDGIAPLEISRLEVYPGEYDRSSLDSLEAYQPDAIEENPASWFDWINKRAIDILEQASLQKLEQTPACPVIGQVAITLSTAR
jgi:hypothetical protein